MILYPRTVLSGPSKRQRKPRGSGVKYLRRLFERKTAILGAILLVFPCARSLAAQVAPNPASETVPPSSSLWPRDLRCEFIVDPLGVQSQQPALSWTLDAREKNARGLRQTAYRVLVSSSRKLLSDDQADVWDSAKTSSNQFVQVRYGGKHYTRTLPISGRSAFGMRTASRRCGAIHQPGRWVCFNPQIGRLAGLPRSPIRSPGCLTVQKPGASRFRRFPSSGMSFD